MSETILHVGRAPELLALRTQILKEAGFCVQEEHDLARALQVASEGSIHLVLLCHSIPSRSCRSMIQGLLSARKVLPIAFVLPVDYQAPPDGALGVPNTPPELIAAIRAILPKSTKRSA